jgi:hypothetical protein
MGFNEGKCISCYLRNLIKGEPCCFLLTPCSPFVNTHASYHVGSNTIGLENAPSFNKANLFSSLDQGKHLAYTLYWLLLYNPYLMSAYTCSISVSGADSYGTSVY